MNLFVEKVLDFFMRVEIRRSNLFKAAFRVIKNTFINRFYIGRIRRLFKK